MSNECQQTIEQFLKTLAEFNVAMIEIDSPTDIDEYLFGSMAMWRTAFSAAKIDPSSESFTPESITPKITKIVYGHLLNAALARQLASLGYRGGKTGAEYRLIVELTRVTKQLKDDIELIKNAPTESQESADDVMGKWAWPNNRARSNKLVGVNEPDTEIEQELLLSLEGFFNHNMHVNAEMAQLVRELVSKKKYADVIKEPPDGTRIYRGLTVSRKWLCAALGVDNLPVMPKVFQVEHVDLLMKNVVNSFSSWTLDESVAKRFSGAGMYSLTTTDDTFSVIVSAQTGGRNTNKLIMCPDGMYRIWNFAINKHESEVVAIDDIVCDTLMWQG